jgi:alkylation response protein AidB-like acyl-CoA dehydrogenase
MKFELDDEHYEYVDVVRTALAKLDAVSVARRVADGDTAAAEPVLGRLAELGVPGLAVPSELGGSGLRPSDCLLVIEQLGRSLVPDLVAETLAVAVPVIVAHGDDALKSELLPRLAAGEAWMTVQDGWDGLASSAGFADLVAVVTPDQVLLCEPGPDSLTETEGVDGTRRPGRVSRSASTVATLNRPAAEEMRARAAATAAALAAGVADGMLASASAYAARRQQFGVPVGSFQGVKHLLAEAFASVEFSRRSAWWAFLELDNGGPGRADAVSIAKATLSEAAIGASYAAMQAHGGIGFTWECDVHLWMRRAQVLAGSWGSADEHWRLLREVRVPLGDHVPGEDRPLADERPLSEDPPLSEDRPHSGDRLLAQ